ncbi:MAG: hypothetical protein HC836_26225 [Richelia sp. RM2_1_2]|nr:hypothetical protein [Richelia sp. RM2_1_2]
MSITTTSAFTRAKVKEYFSIYPFKVKTPFLDYNQDTENFCNENFKNNWCIRFYNEKFRPLAINNEQFYIYSFKNEEDALLFKMSFPNVLPLTQEELNWFKACSR